MKKLILLLAMLVTLCGQAIAESKTITSLDIYQRGHPEQTTARIRMPIHIPISVSFDEETRAIEVTTPDDNIIGQVYLFDESGQIVEYSPIINASFIVSNLGTYTIRIDGDTWYAIGNVDV